MSKVPEVQVAYMGVGGESVDEKGCGDHSGVRGAVKVN